MSSIPPSRPPSGASRPPSNDLSAPVTQIVRDRDAYLGQSPDVGRRLTDEQVEFFAGGEPAPALEREFERLRPRFIALHDLGTSSSLKLLQAMAENTGAKVMRLSIRRQGHGMALATLQFVEIVAGDGTTLRAYSTDVDADSQARQQMAQVLLSHATLGVLVVGELPSHALKSAMQPLLDAAHVGRWACRELLLVPLGSAPALASYAGAFVANSVPATVTPQTARPTDIWSFIGGAWSRLHGAPREAAPPTPPPPAAPPTSAPAPFVDSTARTTSAADSRSGPDSEPPTQPMGLPNELAQAATTGINWFEFVQRCMSIKGLVSCCIFDRATGHALAHAGGRPSAEVMQALGERLLVTASEVGAMVGAGAEVQEALISYPSYHVLLRVLPQHPGIVVHAVLDATTGNAALARVQLHRLEPF